MTTARDDVTQLAEKLKSSSRETRRDAAEQIASLGARGQRIWPAIIEALSDEDMDVARHVGRALAVLEPSPEILHALEEKVAEDRLSYDGAWAVVNAAWRWGPRAVGMASSLVKLEAFLPIDFGDGDSLVDILDQLNWNPRKTFQQLVEELSGNVHDRLPLTAVAMATMIEMGRLVEPKTADALFALADDAGCMRLWLDTLVTTAKEGSEVKRLRALTALGRLEDRAQAVVPELLPLLREESAALRLATANAIGRSGTEAAHEAREALLPLLDDEDSFTRCDACWALGGLGEYAHPAIPKLAHLLGDQGDCGKTTAGSAAAHALWKLGPPSLPSLFEALKSPQATVRGNAVFAIRMILLDHKTVDALPDLKVAMASPEDNIKSSIADAIGVLGRDAHSSEDILIEALTPPGERSSGAIAEALVAIGADPERAVPPLLESLPDGNSYSQQRIAQAVYDLGIPLESLPKLLSSLDESTPKIRYKLLLAIGSLGEAAWPSVPKLIETLKDSDAEVRMGAARALGEIGPVSAAAVPSLVKLLKDSVCLARAEAARALGAIGPAAHEAVPDLESSLEDKGQCLVDFYVIQSLPAIDPEASVPVLIRVLQTHPDGTRRANAAGQLGRLGELARPALPALRDAEARGGPLLKETAQKAIRVIEQQ